MTKVTVAGASTPVKRHGSALFREAVQQCAMMQANVIRQATMLAYIDNFRLLGVVILCLIPCVFLIKKSKPGGEIVVH